MSEEKLVFIGMIVSPKSLGELSITHGFITIEDGKITKKGNKKEYDELENQGVLSAFQKCFLTEHQFLMPGLVDCHVHAPQFPNIGLGLDRPLLEWLDKYTFPLENQYGNVAFARNVYDKVVCRLLRNGTTTASYFGSIHLSGTLELANSVVKYHQRALVGKVSMNIKNDAGYYHETKQELGEVEDFVKSILGLKNDIVQPIISPRFALSCDEELMTGLAKIGAKYNCRIQSHISENLQEIEEVLKLNPSCTSYADVYDKSHLLNNKCIMAHAVHPTDEEISLLAARGVAVAHCPASNTRLKSGLCPARKLLENNVKVGLGTDVSGGDSASILDALRRTMDVSTHLQLQGGAHRAIDWKEALYLATLGGAIALNLDDKIGSLEVGKEFDALLVDVGAVGQIDQYPYTVDKTEEERAVSMLQRFIYLGDDRNISRVYVKGRKIDVCGL